MMIQLPGSTVPVQVKGILTNSTIPITLSAVAGNPVPSTVVSATEPHSGRLFVFCFGFFCGSFCFYVGKVALAKMRLNCFFIRK